MATTNPADESVSIDEQRAQYEQFSFRLAGSHVNVANHSYGDDEAGEHCYSVEIANGQAVRCSCPHWTHRSPSGGCKHMRAVEHHDAVILASTESQ
jgi:hypothetical protein